MECLRRDAHPRLRRPRPMAVVTGVALLLCACISTSESYEEAEDEVENAPQMPPVEQPPVECEPGACAPTEVDCSTVARIGLAGMEPRERNGVEMFLRLEDAGGMSLAAGEHVECLRLLEAGNAGEPAVDLVSAAQPADGALTAVLVAPGSSAASAAQALAMVESFLARRPADERVAIFRWGADVHQISNFTTDRTVALRLAARGLARADETPLPPENAVAAVRSDLESLSQDAFRGVRSIAVMAPDTTLDVLPDVPPNVVTLWHLAPDASDHAIGAVDAEESAAAMSRDLDGHIEAGLARLAWCGSGKPATMLARVPGSDAELVVQTPAPLREERHMQCSPEALAGPRAYPERIEMVFATEEQRQTYQRRVDKLSKKPFEVMLRLWDDGALVETKAKLRGSSSLTGCERKSYNLDIRGPEPRRFTPGSATDEIFLIALCKDKYYINWYTARTLSTRLGFFPLKSRFVELVVDDEHRGIYLLVEKPQDAFRDANSRVQSVVRRNNDSKGHSPSVKYAHESKDQARDDYQALLDRLTSATGSELTDAAAMSMDIDQYLRWIALMTLLRNGDYIDEVYFVATQTLDASLEPTDFYTIVSWDPDDLFSRCHGGGQYAIDDPNGLLFCTESVIDHSMFADSQFYTRYVTVLESVLDEISQDIFDAALDETVAHLDTYFQSEVIRMAMIEIHDGDWQEPPRYEEVMGAITEAAVEMKRKVADRHSELREAIAVWRAGRS